MTRNEMIDELLARLEGELDELSNAQLSSLLNDFEDTQILSGVVESLADDTDDDVDENDTPLIDGEEWDEEE